MKSLIEYLGCGFKCSENRGTIDFKVSKRDIVIPFFDKHPLQGNKSQDYSGGQINGKHT